MTCRHCRAPLDDVFLDLGFAPPSNAYLSASDLEGPERYYPLKLYVCSRCWLVQTKDYAQASELFSNDYAYFSSTSTTWLTHAARYCHTITERLRLDAKSMVIEVACNDGYLLKNFVAAGIPCLGIEPTQSTALAAEKLGIPVLREFFGSALAGRLAAQGPKADLIVGNNVYAHVPDVNDFTAGLALVLSPSGTITLEFPHLLRLIDQIQFDTTYHEHFSYFSLGTVDRVMKSAAGLRVFDVEELPTHGGSLRVYACHDADPRPTSENVQRILRTEACFGLQALSTYTSFQPKADAVKDGLLRFLIDQKRKGVKVGAYGAAAKGNTLLNYGGVKPDLLPYVCDSAPAKQGKYLPGSHIPIVAPGALQLSKPEILLILPWNIADEVIHQHAYIRAWRGRFAVAVPELKVMT